MSNNLPTVLSNRRIPQAVRERLMEADRPNVLMAGQPIVATSANRFVHEFGRPERALTVGYGVAGQDWTIFAYGETKADIVGLPRFYDGYAVSASVIGKVRAL